MTWTMAQWVGNTPEVLRRHYLQTRGRQFIDAVKQSASESASVSVGQGMSSPNATLVFERVTRFDMRGMSVIVPGQGPEGPSDLPKTFGKRSFSRKSASLSASPQTPEEWTLHNVRALRAAGVIIPRMATEGRKAGGR